MIPPPVVQEPATGYVVLQMASTHPDSPTFMIKPQTGDGTRSRGGRALRSNASRNGPFGLCQAESFGNSIADSVSFRLPSWQSLDGLRDARNNERHVCARRRGGETAGSSPVPPAISAPGYATPRERPQQHKKKRTGHACFSLQRVHWSILDCACSASGRISRLPSPLGGDGVRF